MTDPLASYLKRRAAYWRDAESLADDMRRRAAYYRERGYPERAESCEKAASRYDKVANGSERS